MGDRWMEAFLDAQDRIRATPEFPRLVRVIRSGNARRANALADLIMARLGLAEPMLGNVLHAAAQSADFRQMRPKTYYPDGDAPR
jgi:hypothetical protein